jgi:nucleoside-diphosphate-sugar epimerase
MAGHAARFVIERAGMAGYRQQNHQDGVEAARMCGIESYPLRLEPQLVCDAEDLDALMNVDALVITLPSQRAGEDFYLQAVQEIVDTALAYHIPRIVFTSSTSVYGNASGMLKRIRRAIRKPPAAGC